MPVCVVGEGRGQSVCLSVCVFTCILYFSLYYIHAHVAIYSMNVLLTLLKQLNTLTYVNAGYCCILQLANHTRLMQMMLAI